MIASHGLSLCCADLPSTRLRQTIILQAAIAKEAAVGASRKVFDLALDQLGPYSLAFNRSGRQLLLGGRKGHLALLDWQQARPLAEVQVLIFAAESILFLAIGFFYVWLQARA